MQGRLKQAIHIVSYLYVRSLEKIGYWNDIDEVSKYLFISSLPMRQNEKNLMEKIDAQSAKLRTGEEASSEAAVAPDGRLTLVVSVTEKYENSETLPFMDPTRKEEWEQKFNVHHDQVLMEDFSGGNDIDIQSAVNAVSKIQQHRESKQSVLVHCKAGRTRSAMIVACVLAVFDLGQMKENADKSPRQLIDMAVELIQKHRSQVKLHEENKVTAVKIVNAVRAALASTASLTVRAPEAKAVPASTAELTLKEKVDILFANPDFNFKDEVINMDAFKNLCAYKNKLQEEAVFKSPKRAQHIGKIISSLRDAKDSSWLAELVNESGAAHDLLAAHPKFVKDKAKEQNCREELVEKLRNDVENLICLNLGCSVAELESVYKVPVKKEQLQPS